MTKLFLLSAMLGSLNIFGQTKSFTEKSIYSIFKKTIAQENKKKIRIPSNPWLICNADSSFYKKDTIRAISNSYHSSKHTCCEYVGWTFYEKNKFISNTLQLCKEPTTASFTTTNDHFTLEVFSSDNYLYLSTSNSIKIIDRFKILDIATVRLENSDSTSTVITLLRLK